MLRAIGIRVAVGVIITFIGFLVSVVTKDSGIFTNWTSGLGFIILVIAGLPLMGPTIDLKALRLAKDKNKAIAAMEKNREQLLGWSLSLLIVALPVVILPTLVYLEFMQ